MQTKISNIVSRTASPDWTRVGRTRILARRRTNARSLYPLARLRTNARRTNARSQTEQECITETDPSSGILLLAVGLINARS